MEIGPNGVLLVGPLFMYSATSSFTDFGVTFSIIINAGRRRTVVGSE